MEIEIAVKLSTKNDPSGNPRRGWLVYSVEVWSDDDAIQPQDKLLGWVEEGYKGIGALREKAPHARVIVEVQVPYSEYKEARANPHL